MNKILGILNIVVLITCCYILNVSLNRLTAIAEETLKNSQPEQLRVIDEKYILDKEL